MKKKELETLEKINKERNLSKDVKEIILKKVLKNFLFATVILLFFIILMIIERNFNKTTAVLAYKIISFVLISITLVLFEISYKKDNGNIAVTSIEMFILSIITLLTPYTLINRKSIYSFIIGVFFVVYYAIKNYVIYRIERNRYLKEKNDISEIIKKESQDELAKEHFEKIKQQKEIKPRKRKTTKKNTKVVKAKQNETTEKRKRGRPKKVNN